MLDKNRRKPNLRNRVDEATENAVVRFAIEFPAFVQARAANELRKSGICLSSREIRCIWMMHGLEVFKKRLTSLEKKMAKENIVLTEAQVQALVKKKEDDLATVEIETAHPGYFGSQDTFYVETI